jgi:hypothetical protein
MMNHVIEEGAPVSESRQPWYKSPLFVGAVITAAGFGFFTLLYFLVTLLLLR